MSLPTRPLGAATLHLADEDLDEIAAPVGRTGAGTGPVRPSPSPTTGANR